MLLGRRAWYKMQICNFNIHLEVVRYKNMRVGGVLRIEKCASSAYSERPQAGAAAQRLELRGLGGPASSRRVRRASAGPEPLLSGLTGTPLCLSS